MFIKKVENSITMGGETVHKAQQMLHLESIMACPCLSRILVANVCL